MRLANCAFFLGTFLFFAEPSQIYSQPGKDSLTVLLKRASPLTNKNNDSAYILALRAIRISKQANKPYELAQALSLAGLSKYFQSNYPEALEYYQESEKMAEKYKYNDVLLQLYNYIGTFYKKQNQLTKSLEVFKKGNRLAE